MNDQPTLARIRHHDRFYIRGGDVTFLVEGILFRVHKYFFERDSYHFRTELSVPASPGEPPRGTSDTNAFSLEGITAADFELFLWVFYNPTYSMYDAPLSSWIRILELAHDWKFGQVKDLASRQLEKEEIEPIQKIVIYHKYGLDHTLLIPSYAALCVTDEIPGVEDCTRLGMETVVKLFKSREQIRSRYPSPTDEEMHEVIQAVFGLGTSNSSSPQQHSGGSATTLADSMAETSTEGNRSRDVPREEQGQDRSEDKNGGNQNPSPDGLHVHTDFGSATSNNHNDNEGANENQNTPVPKQDTVDGEDDNSANADRFPKNAPNGGTGNRELDGNGDNQPSSSSPGQQATEDQLTSELNGGYTTDKGNANEGSGDGDDLDIKDGRGNGDADEHENERNGGGEHIGDEGSVDNDGSSIARNDKIHANGDHVVGTNDNVSASDNQADGINHNQSDARNNPTSSTHDDVQASGANKEQFAASTNANQAGHSNDQVNGRETETHTNHDNYDVTRENGWNHEETKSPEGSGSEGNGKNEAETCLDSQSSADAINDQYDDDRGRTQETAMGTAGNNVAVRSEDEESSKANGDVGGTDHGQSTGSDERMKDDYAQDQGGGGENASNNQEVNGTGSEGAAGTDNSDESKRDEGNRSNGQDDCGVAGGNESGEVREGNHGASEGHATTTTNGVVNGKTTPIIGSRPGEEGEGNLGNQKADEIVDGIGTMSGGGETSVHGAEGQAITICEQNGKKARTNGVNSGGGGREDEEVNAGAHSEEGDHVDKRDKNAEGAEGGTLNGDRRQGNVASNKALSSNGFRVVEEDDDEDDDEFFDSPDTIVPPIWP